MRSSLRPSAEDEEQERQRLERARAPLAKKSSQYHAQRFNTPDEQTAQQKLLKQAKAGWRQHDEHKKMLGKLEFLVRTSSHTRAVPPSPVLRRVAF